MRDEAERRIGHLYPKVRVTAEMAADRPDLEPYVGRELTVIAWLWARTVKSPNPAFARHRRAPRLDVSSSPKEGQGAWVEPVIEEGRYYRFEVRAGITSGVGKNGHASLAGMRSSFSLPAVCALPDATYRVLQGREAKQVAEWARRLMAIVAEGNESERCTYLRTTGTITKTHRSMSADPRGSPENEPAGKALRNFQGPVYGMQ